MPTKETVLTPARARVYYDRFGKKQDSQGFYEDPALDELIAHGSFPNARQIFEFGCGTGKLATRLLASYLPATAHYVGQDLSPVMVDLATRRLEPFSSRARIVLGEAGVTFPSADNTVDRVVSSYVLDPLSEADTRQFFTEAYRVMAPDGRVCLAGLCPGSGPVSRLVASVWRGVFNLKPSLVGGCRPVSLTDYVNPHLWRIEYQAVVTPFGVPSEVLILDAKGKPVPDAAHK